MSELVTVNLIDFPSPQQQQEGCELYKFLKDQFHHKKLKIPFSYSNFRKTHIIKTRRWKRRFNATSFEICKSLGYILLLDQNRNMYIYSLKTKKFITQFLLLPFDYERTANVTFKVVEREHDRSHQVHLIVLVFYSLNYELEIHKINFESLLKEQGRMSRQDAKLLDCYANNLVWKSDKKKIKHRPKLQCIPNRDFEKFEKDDNVILICFSSAKAIDCYSYNSGKLVNSLNVADIVKDSYFYEISTCGTDLLFYTGPSFIFVDQRMNIIKNLAKNGIGVTNTYNILPEPNANLFIIYQSPHIWIYKYFGDTPKLVNRTYIIEEKRKWNYVILNYNDSNGELYMLNHDKLYIFK